MCSLLEEEIRRSNDAYAFFCEHKACQNMTKEAFAKQIEVGFENKLFGSKL